MHIMYRVPLLHIVMKYSLYLFLPSPTFLSISLPPPLPPPLLPSSQYNSTESSEEQEADGTRCLLRSQDSPWRGLELG